MEKNIKIIIGGLVVSAIGVGILLSNKKEKPSKEQIASGGMSLKALGATILISGQAILAYGVFKK